MFAKLKPYKFVVFFNLEENKFVAEIESTTWSLFDSHETIGIDYNCSETRLIIDIQKWRFNLIKLRCFTEKTITKIIGKNFI